MSKVWDERHAVIDKQLWSGTGALNGTLDNSAVVDTGGGLVTIAITAHGMVVGNMIIIAGTTNYDGVHIIRAVAVNSIDILATFVAETPAGTETYKTCFQIDPTTQDYMGYEIRLTLSAAGGSVENYTVNLDSINGAAWDIELVTEAMNAQQYVDTVWALDERRYFNGGDVILFNYANTNGRTWGLEFIIRRES